MMIAELMAHVVKLHGDHGVNVTSHILLSADSGRKGLFLPSLHAFAVCEPPGDSQLHRFVRCLK